MIHIFLAFITGVIIVINMMLSGKLAKKVGMVNGLFLNYAMGAISSLLLCTIMINSITSYESLKEVPLPYFLGGFIGIITTYLNNVIVPNVPAVYAVILVFLGQMLTSIIIDYFFLDIFSAGKLIGCILFFLGLLWNARVDIKYKLNASSNES